MTRHRRPELAMNFDQDLGRRNVILQDTSEELRIWTVAFHDVCPFEIRSIELREVFTHEVLDAAGVHDG